MGGAFPRAGLNRYDALSRASGEAMRRREFIKIIAGSVATWPLALAPECADAQYQRPARPAPPRRSDTFTPDQVVRRGSDYFGTASRGLAKVVEEAFSRWGQPNGYVLGQETGGAFMAGLRYGDGTLYTRNAGDRRVFWQGPSVGFDVGGEGARTMMLVYNLPATDAIYQRFAGIEGSGLCHRRLWDDRARLRQHHRRADPLGRWLAARCQYRLPQILAAGDLESVLIAAHLRAAVRLECRSVYDGSQCPLYFAPKPRFLPLR